MMIKSRRFAAGFLLAVFLCCVQPRQADAFAPVIVGAAAIGISMITIGAFSVYKPTSVPSGWPKSAVLTNMNNVVRAGIGAQMYLANQYGQQMLKGAVVGLKTSLSNIAGMFATHPEMSGVYPSMYNSLMKDVPSPVATQSTPVGAKIRTDAAGATAGIVTSTRTPWYSSYPINVLPVPSPEYSTDATGHPVVTIVVLVNPSLGTLSPYYGFQFVCNQSPLDKGPKAPSEVRQGLTPVSGYQSVPLTDGMLDDLDRMIVANANGFGVSIIDATTADDADDAKVLNPPAPDVMPIDISLPTVQPGTMSGVGAANNAAAQGRVAAAEAAKAKAQADVDEYKQGHPDATVDNDPVLRDLVKELADMGDLVKSKVDAQTQTEREVEEAYPNASVDEIHKIKWDAFKNLVGVVSTTWPFSLLDGVSGYYSAFVATPHAPVFVVPLPLGFQITVDLTPWDTVAEIIRYCLAVMLTSGVVLYIVRFWRGVA